MSERIQPFTPLLKLKANQKFVWGEEQHKDLDNVKQYLKSPPILMPPQDNKAIQVILISQRAGYWIGPYARV
jgi:hypothetical protein